MWTIPELFHENFFHVSLVNWDGRQTPSSNVPKLNENLILENLKTWFTFLIVKIWYFHCFEPLFLSSSLYYFSETWKTSPLLQNTNILILKGNKYICSGLRYLKVKNVINRICSYVSVNYVNKEYWKNEKILNTKIKIWEHFTKL